MKIVPGGHVGLQVESGHLDHGLENLAGDAKVYLMSSPQQVVGLLGGGRLALQGQVAAVGGVVQFPPGLLGVVPLHGDVVVQLHHAADKTQGVQVLQHDLGLFAAKGWVFLPGRVLAQEEQGAAGLGILRQGGVHRQDVVHEIAQAVDAVLGGQIGPQDLGGGGKSRSSDGANFRNLKEPSVISEYGSTQENRPGSFIPGYGDLTHSLKPDEIAACAWRFPWRSGESLWCAFDHGSIAGRKFGSMGFIDYYRLPKRMWYWYRENYAHVPHPTWPVSGTPAALQLTASSPSIQHADGTDDVQIKVTVVDNNGTWISNAMPVTFSVESGPGELPTGRRLTFDPKSDITMADGLAAIDMRAYYSGNTVLKASAAGLPDAKITIPSSGGPSFVPGQTLLCTERPYLGASGADQRALQEFGLNNPTEASSQATGHEAPNANDGNDKTWWQAADSNTGAWWMVDLERNVSIEKVSMKFPSRGAWKVKIEVSADKVKWTPFAESDSSETAALVFEGKAQSTSGFVRVTFEELPKGQSAQLTELRVTGQLTGQ